MAPSRKAARPSGCIPASEDQFKAIGGEIMGRDPEGRSTAVFETQWRSFFGVDPGVVVQVWDLIEVPYFHDGDLSQAKPKHLLWALLFLRKYGDESEMAKLVGKDGKAIDEQTFRKWSKIFIRRIALRKYDVVRVVLAPLPLLLLLLSYCRSLLLVHLFLSYRRLFGRTGRLETLVMTV